MDVAVFPSCSLASGDNGDLFQRTYASMPCTQLPGLLKSVLLTPWQATVDPRLQQKLLETHRQICLSLLWGHCSFLLGPGVHKVLFVPSKSVSPVLWKFCDQIPLAFKVKVPGSSQSLCWTPRLSNLLWALELCNSVRTSLMKVLHSIC